ncbi:hypothetical protein Tco_1437869, partial [Tanacetum coccineum]
RTTSAVDLEEFCEKHYEKLLPIMADKYEYEKRKKEKLEEAKARLDFGDARKKSTKAQESAYSESKTISPRRQRRSQDGVHPRTPIAVRKTQGILKSSQRKKFSIEDDDLSQPWVCAETDPFTSRIRHFDFPKTTMPSSVITTTG